MAGPTIWVGDLYTHNATAVDQGVNNTILAGHNESSAPDFSPADLRNAKVSFVDKPSVSVVVEYTVHGFIDVLPEQISLLGSFN